MGELTLTCNNHLKFNNKFPISTIKCKSVIMNKTHKWLWAMTKAYLSNNNHKTKYKLSKFKHRLFSSSKLNMLNLKFNNKHRFKVQRWHSIKFQCKIRIRFNNQPLWVHLHQLLHLHKLFKQYQLEVFLHSQHKHKLLMFQNLNHNSSKYLQWLLLWNRFH